MRIGLTGGAATIDRIVEQAQNAERDGFSSLWYASAVAFDPMAAIAIAGRATETIEFGTSVLQTYTCHPVLQANRAAAVVNAIGAPRFTLGVGPSHQPPIEGAYGLDYSHAGRHTDEYVQVLTALLRGETVAFEGADFRVHATGPQQSFDIPVLVAALAPRLLRAAGEHTAGTILWMANERSIAEHVAPRIRAAAEAAGRPAPRIVAGLPVAVHHDADEAHEVAARVFEGYGVLPNYRRILDLGHAPGPADAAIVGDEAAVEARIRALFDAGATDVWAAIFTVGDDGSGSRRRTRALLKDLAAL